MEKGNPQGIKSLDDLKGKEVGAVAGSAQDEYARHLGATTVPFQTDAEEFPAIVQGRVKILLEDNVLFYNFMKANPAAPIEIVPNVSSASRIDIGLWLRLRALRYANRGLHFTRSLYARPCRASRRRDRQRYPQEVWARPAE